MFVFGKEVWHSLVLDLKRLLLGKNISIKNISVFFLKFEERKEVSYSMQILETGKIKEFNF